jgi:hypothetical protein
LAQSPDAEASPDSLAAEPAIADSLAAEPVSADSSSTGPEELEINEQIFPYSVLGDSLESDDGPGEPIYKQWWVWAALMTGIAVTAVLVGGGEEEKQDEELPDFPDPPDR